MTSSQSEHETTNRSTAIRCTGIGLTGLVIALPILAIPLIATNPSQSTVVGPIPAIDGVSLIPDFSESTNVDEWVRQMLVGLFHIAYIGCYYISLGISVIGLLLLIVGVIIAQEIQELLVVLLQLAQNRLIQGVFTFYGTVAAAILVPALLRLLVEISIAIGIGGSLLVVIGSSWITLRTKAGPMLRIILVYPLGVGTLVLPVIGTALVSPTFADATQSLTSDVAVFFLSTILEPLRVAEWFSKTFDLEGTSFFIMWFSLTVVIGWIVGIVSEALLKRVKIESV